MLRNEIPPLPDGDDNDGAPAGPGAATLATGSVEGEAVEEIAPDSRPRPLNFRFILIFAAIIAIVSFGTAKLHDYQMRRMAGTILSRAEQARADGNFSEAVTLYRRYLNLVPRDVQAKTALAFTLHETADSPRQRYQAFVLYEELLRRDESRSDVRRKLIDLLIGFGRFGDAIFHLKFLLHSTPGDAELLALSAQCYDRSQKNTEAVAAYEAAIKAAPRNIDNYAALARVLSDRLERSADAEKVLDRLVAANPTSHESYLTRAEFRVERGNVKAAVLDARRALQLAPESPEALLLAATILRSGVESGIDENLFDVPQIRSRLETTLKSMAPSQSPSDDETIVRTRLVEALVQLDRLVGRTDEAERRLRAELETDPDNPALVWLLADLLVTQKDVAGARAEVERLTRQKASPALIAYVEGRIALIERDWRTAIEKLEGLRTEWFDRAEVRAHLNLHLAECYRQLGHTERELAAFRRAVEANPFSPRAHVGLASAAARLGRVDLALVHYGQVADRPGIRGRIAQLTLHQTMQLPPDERDWQKVEAAIDAAAHDSTSVTDALLLRARLLIYRNEGEQARDLLQRAVQRRPQDVQLWIALAELHDQNGNPASAEKTLEQAQAKLGSRIDFALAWIQHWAKRGGEQARAELERLEGTQERFDETGRLQLLDGLAAAYEWLGDDDQAERLWQEMTRHSPRNLHAQRRLLELAFRQGDFEKAQARLAMIRNIEGKDGIYWRLGEAQSALIRARAGDDAALEVAEQNLAHVAKQIPNSPRIALAYAELFEAQGRYDQAITRYLEALERGDRSPQTISRVVKLLYRRQRYYEAEQIIHNFQRGALNALTPGFGRLATAVSLQTKDYDRALKFARQAVADGASDYRDHIWLGQVLHAAGRTAEAEKAFRGAVEEAPDQPEPWVALVSFLSATGRSDEARQVIEESHSSIAPEHRVLTLAQCYELMGDREQAAKHYRAALESEGDAPNVVWSVAEFEARRRNWAAAERLLRKLLQPEWGVQEALAAAARRRLAEILSVQGKPGSLREGLALIEQNLSASQNHRDDLRVKARLLASQPLKNSLRDAVTLLESLEERTSLTADDHLLLARLYLALDNWPAASQRLLMLMTGYDPTPDHLAFGIRAMLDHGETEGTVTEWLDALQKRQPDAFRTKELHARRLALDDQIDEAVALLTRELAPDQLDTEAEFRQATAAAAVFEDLSQRLEQVGRTLAADRLGIEAERLYRLCAEKSPPRSILLAQFLGRQWRVDEALEICQHAWNILPADVVAVACVEIVRSGRANDSQTQRVAAWLDSALKESPDSAELHFQRAHLAQYARDYAAAIQHYRKTVELAPDTVVAYNELALLLALQGPNAVKALESINNAIDRAGPLPFLLDTRATVYLALDQTDAAIADLEKAIADTPTPAKHFHLAQALAVSGNRAAAQHSLRTAVSLGLHADSIHPLEQPAYQQLTEELQRP